MKVRSSLASLPVMLTVLPVAPLNAPAPELNVPRVLSNEMALVPPVDVTLLNCRFIKVPLPSMLIAPPDVLLISPAVTVFTLGRRCSCR